MPKEPAWLKGFYQIDNFTGGSLIARGYSPEAEVAFTKFGEVSVKFEEEGELCVDFPELGVYTIYQQDGELGFVGLELSRLLGNIPIADLGILAKQGEEVLELLRVLKENNEELFISVYPQTGEVVIALEGDEETEALDESECDDFTRGYGGDITLGDCSICYHVIDKPDEFRVSIGESDGEKRSLVPVSIAHRVNIGNFLRSREADRFTKLAQEVFPKY